jgi:hypothetical protein
VPSLHAFSYTIASEADGPPTLVIAGSGEAPEGQGSYQERCVRRGDLSPEGMREKARFVLGGVVSAHLRRIGGIPPRPKSTQYMTSILFSPMRSCGAEPPKPG